MPQQVNEFLNPKSMVTPGIAGGAIVLIASTLRFHFDLEPKYVALGLSALMSVAVMHSLSVSTLEKIIYGVLNTLVIFSTAMGANSVAAKVTDQNPEAEGALLRIFNPSPSLYAAPQSLRDGEVIRLNGRDHYLFIDGTLRYVPDPMTFNSLGLKWDMVRDVPEANVAAVPRGRPYPSIPGRLVRGTNPSVFLLEAGRRRGFPDADTFEAWGYKWKDVKVLTDADLNSIPAGPGVTKAKKFFRAW